MRPNPCSGWLKIADSRAAKAHVARQYELAAGAAHASLDLCDGHEPAFAQVPK
jgi:hypothetical protein